MTSLPTPRAISCLVACKNQSGASDMFHCTIEATQADIDENKHHETAISQATEQGYFPPFLCFDHNEQANIVKQISKTDHPIPFEIEDQHSDDGSSLAGSIQFGYDGMNIQLNGHSDFSSQDDVGFVALLENWKETASIRVYSDINAENPTHILSLDGARNKMRID